MTMTYTKEQEIIIDTPIQVGESLFVNALAGTGKTTTLVELAKSQPQKQFIYICFNNKGAQEAQAKFRQEGVRNAKASTIHGLAREAKNRFEHARKFQTKIHLKTIQDKLKCTMPTAWWVSNTLKSFCESADTKVTIENVPYCGGVASIKQAIADAAAQIWKSMIDEKDPFPISFDGYLKWFQLQNPRLSYDYILLDEAQDSNPVTLSIVRAQRKSTRIVLIGDNSQKIYSWRGAVNAFLGWDADHTHELTESFRFGPNIAKVANLILQNFQKRPASIVGFQPKDSLGFVDEKYKHTFIARTNSSLYEQAINFSDLGKKIHFIGTKAEDGWDPSMNYKFNEARDVYSLFIGEKEKVRNPYFKNFKDYEELEQIAKGTIAGENQSGDTIKGDVELAGIVRLIDKHKQNLPKILETITQACTSEEEADIVLVTAHRAKGLEWDVVKLADDFTDLIIKEEDKKKKKGNDETRGDKTGEDGKEIRLAIPEVDKPIDEYNLIYVAATRAKSHLDIGKQLRDLLKHQDLLEHPVGLKEVDYIAVETKAKPAQAKPAGPPVIFLKIPFPDKDDAKKNARAAGGVILWNNDKRLWLWKGGKLPAGLAKFAVQGD